MTKKARLMAEGRRIDEGRESQGTCAVEWKSWGYEEMGWIKQLLMVQTEVFCSILRGWLDQQEPLLVPQHQSNEAALFTLAWRNLERPKSKMATGNYTCNHMGWWSSNWIKRKSDKKAKVSWFSPLLVTQSQMHMNIRRSGGREVSGTLWHGSPWTVVPKPSGGVPTGAIITQREYRTTSVDKAEVWMKFGM